MFFAIVMVVNLLVNLYIYFRTKTVFPESTAGWWAALLLFWLVAFSYVIGRFIERAGNETLAEFFITIGSWWLGAMIYLTLLFILADITRGISGLVSSTGLFSFSWLSEKGRLAVFSMYAITALILIAGYYNARVPVARQVSLQIDKPVSGGSQKIVLISDIHLGITITNGKLNNMVNLVNRQNADIILLAGDIFDEDLGPVISNNMGELLRNLKAKHGVFAILGNHEFYGNAKAAQKYLEEHNITVLRDSVAVLPGGTVIAGREDLTGERMYGKRRKTINQLLSGVQANKPIILMDHQPVRLEEVVSGGVDLQVSGHTHHGQMWPFNFITGAIFEISKGYGKIGNTHFYVSSGYGTWGPPIRTNSRSEIVVLNIQGT